MKRTDITAQFPDATAEQIDALLAINGSDITKAKGDLSAMSAKVTELQGTIDAANAAGVTAEALKALQTELDGLKGANAIRDMREAVAKNTGVPAALLTCDTEEACKAQAAQIQAFAAQSNKPGYPTLPDGGEVNAPSTGSTRDKFAAWFNESQN